MDKLEKEIVNIIDIAESQAEKNLEIFVRDFQNKLKRYTLKNHNEQISKEHKILIDLYKNQFKYYDVVDKNLKLKLVPIWDNTTLPNEADKSDWKDSFTNKDKIRYILRNKFIILKKLRYLNDLQKP